LSQNALCEQRAAEFDTEGRNWNFNERAIIANEFKLNGQILPSGFLIKNFQIRSSCALPR
jgi:hypothetical protein